jgi:DNA helicase-2/ATP-dependent DNA helicase PcrA
MLTVTDISQYWFIFWHVDKSKLKYQTDAGIPPEQMNEDAVNSLIKETKISRKSTSCNSANFQSNLQIGNVVMHERFGRTKY